MQNKLNDRFPSCLIHCCCTTFRPRPLNLEPLRFVLVPTLAATMLKLYSFNPLWTMNTTVFQETSNLYHILEPIIGRLFQNITLGRSLRSSFIDPFSFAKKRCNTSQGFDAFFLQSCDQLLLLFFFSLSQFFPFFLDFYGN